MPSQLCAKRRRSSRRCCAPKPRRRAALCSCQNPLSAPNVGAQPTGGIPRTISADGASLCNSNSTAGTPALAATTLAAAHAAAFASTHASTTFATATATVITASATALALASTTLATALAFVTLATAFASATPTFTILATAVATAVAAACFQLFPACLLALLACLWVPEIPWLAPNVGAQATGVEFYRTARADGALLCVSNSPAVAAAVTPSAVTAVAAPVEADLR
jgi:hypothetical protein